MMTGKERVLALLNGQKPDCHPQFDVIRNDAIIEYFAGEKLTYDNAERVVRLAHARGVDSTRMIPKIPVPPISDKLPDGREVKYERWMRWAQHNQYDGLEGWCRAKAKKLEGPVMSEAEIAEVKRAIDFYQKCDQDLNDIYFMWSLGEHDKHQFGVETNSYIGYYLTELYDEIGLDKFGLYLYQAPDLISEILERHFQKSLATLKIMAELNARPVALFIADDLAFKTGPFVSPAWLEKEYFPRLKPVCDLAHEMGILVAFHTDGDLDLIIDGLVAAGIDMLNPIEKVRFYVKEIHQRCPNLIMTGSIDISHLLPFGTPAEIRDQVRRNIDDAEGKILVGSSSIIANNVPLENYLAMREALGMD